MAMLVEAGWSSIEKLREGIVRGRLNSFGDLLDSVTATVERLPNRLRRAHDDVVMAVTLGDPTPFKDFRRAEYRETVDRMTPMGKVRRRRRGCSRPESPSPQRSGGG